MALYLADTAVAITIGRYQPSFCLICILSLHYRFFPRVYLWKNEIHLLIQLFGHHAFLLSLSLSLSLSFFLFLSTPVRSPRAPPASLPNPLDRSPGLGLGFGGLTRLGLHPDTFLFTVRITSTLVCFSTFHLFIRPRHLHSHADLLSWAARLHVSDKRLTTAATMAATGTNEATALHT